MVAVCLLALAGCAQDGASPSTCDAPPTEEVAAMCAIDRARGVAERGDLDGALAACQPIPAGRWRDECRFRVAEEAAGAGAMSRAIEICGAATSFAQMCAGHVAWLRSEALVDAGPADADAQEGVDAVVEAFPDVAGVGDTHRARGGVREIARGAAWHGIYAGSGSTDPTAARGARAAEAAFARGAFAWEATRILGPTMDPVQLMDRVLAIWRGDAAPVTAAPLPEACWTARLVPRTQLGYGEAPTIRTFSGGERFVADDPEVDLRVATLEARWAAGVDFDGSFLRSLAAPASPWALRLTAARHIGADAAAVPDVEGPLGDRPELVAVARAVRTAASRGSTERPVAPKDEARCGG
jgi:hypothetical protein